MTTLGQRHTGQRNKNIVTIVMVTIFFITSGLRTQILSQIIYTVI